VNVRLEPSNTCGPLPVRYQSTYSQHIIASRNPGFRSFACPLVFLPSLFHHQPFSVHKIPSLLLQFPSSCCFVQNPVLASPCLYQRGFRVQHLPWWQRQFVLKLWFTVTGLHSKHVIYRVIHKSLRDYRPLRYGSQDGHAEGEHVNRGRDTPGFCPTLQVLDMSTLGDPTDVNFWQIRRYRTLFLFPVHAMFRHDCPLAVETCKYATALSTRKNLERFSTYWYAPFCCVCLGCCAAEFGSSGGTYELPCIYIYTHTHIYRVIHIIHIYI